MKKYDVVALGELLIDFTQNGYSEQGNPIFEANPGGAPCNVLAMLQKLGINTDILPSPFSSGAKRSAAIICVYRVSTTYPMHWPPLP